MGDFQREEFNQEVFAALLDSQAVNLEAVSTIIGSYADKAARLGGDVAFIINKRNFWACGDPRPVLGEVFQGRESG